GSSNEGGSELELLKRLDRVEALRPGFLQAADAAGLVERLQAVPCELLQHVAVSCDLFNDDLTALTRYGPTPANSSQQRTLPVLCPAAQTAAFLFTLVGGGTERPPEYEPPAGESYGRTSLYVALRLHDRLLGVLGFRSGDSTPYTSDDLAVCRRV